MTLVITEPCIGVKDASCLAICPIDCIESSAEEPQFYINPDECIDCGACAAECPVGAIFAEDELPVGQEHFLERNAAFFQRTQADVGTVLDSGLEVV